MIVAFIVTWLLICLIANTKKRIIKRKGKDYLIRFTILKTKYFSLKIHKALMSDPANLHDHPWNYISLILWGGYWEWTRTYKPAYLADVDLLPPFVDTKKWYKPLSILRRKGNTVHRLEIPKGKSCWSLILTFNRHREWGFVDSEGKWQHNEQLIKSDY